MAARVGIATALRGRRVINARGYSTKVGGSRLAPEVIEAMAEAAGFFVRMEDMQAAAGGVIAELTGAEAGYVTPGASAGLTMATAAALARLDPGRMNRLPDTRGMPDRIVLLRRHRNDYDHALRVAGARLVEVGYHDWTFDYEVEEAIDPMTAGLFYMGSDDGANLSVEQVVEIAHRHDLPVIVDASVALPPSSNLRRFIEVGADLVAFSGGKHIQGPQASGILAGRRDLITSVAMQHQDMDVYPATWPARDLIDQGVMSGPPHHGLGRGFKVGKEEIAGLVAALRLYVERDFEAERARLAGYADLIVDGLAGVAGVRAVRVDAAATGRPGPRVDLHVDPGVAGIDATGLINRLQGEDPLVCAFEAWAARGTVGLYPDALANGEPEELVAVVRGCLPAG
jgi:D-glucosaminate-6-phosphate ammonia-lyase